MYTNFVQSKSGKSEIKFNVGFNLDWSMRVGIKLGSRPTAIPFFRKLVWDFIAMQQFENTEYLPIFFIAGHLYYSFEYNIIMGGAGQASGGRTEG